MTCHFIANARLCASLFFCLSFVVPPGSVDAADKPNFVLILADDQGWNALSTRMDPDLPGSGSMYYQTPNLDRFAAQGMRFSHAYAPAPTCSPTRHALQFGRSPASLKIFGADGIRDWDAGNDESLANSLKKIDPDYVCAHLGKWHIGRSPEALGYDVSDGSTGNGTGNSDDLDDPKRIFDLSRRSNQFIRKQVEAAPPRKPKPRRSVRMPSPKPSEGWIKPFNGEDLTGWDGADGFWRVSNGTIIGETTSTRPLEHHSYLIWRGGEVADFELRLKFRISRQRGNSGIQYRSRDLGNHNVAGYQYNIQATHHGATAVLEEMKNGRGGHLASVGQRVHLSDGDQRKVIGKTGDADEINASLKHAWWNAVVIRAEGNRLQHWLNGHLAVETIDNDAAKSAKKGVLAFQLHSGPSMRIELKEIRLLHLKPAMKIESGTTKE